MPYKQNVINDFNKNISNLIASGKYKSYLISLSFNMIDCDPDCKESELIDLIIQKRNNDPISLELPALYKRLSDYRFKINKSINSKIYEKSITQKRVSYVWKTYEKFQSHLVQRLIKNASRPNKIDLHPKTYDFIDVNGSKRHNYVYDMDGTLHIHSIYLIRNEIVEKFEGLVAQDFQPILWHPNLSGVRDVHAIPIKSGPDDLPKTIEYASKFMVSFDPMGWKDDLPLSFQYPLTDDERRQRRADAQRLAAAGATAW